MTPIAAVQSACCKMRFIVASEHGLHMRAAALLVKIANSYDAQLTIEHGEHRVDGRSLMGLLALGIPQGQSLVAVAEGPEADAMMWALTDLFATRFYEASGASKGPRA